MEGFQIPEKRVQSQDSAKLSEILLYKQYRIFKGLITLMEDLLEIGSQLRQLESELTHGLKVNWGSSS